MQILILFLVTSIVFLVADAIMLRFVIQPLFQHHLGAQLLDGVSSMGRCHYRTDVAN